MMNKTAEETTVMGVFKEERSVTDYVRSDMWVLSQQTPAPETTLTGLLYEGLTISIARYSSF